MAAVIFAGWALFQLLLALGAPLGAAAWGGAHRTLPAGLRIASVVAVLMYVLASLVVLRRAGFRLRGIPWGFSRWDTWALVVILALSVIVNLLSASLWERYFNAPVAALLGFLCLIIARSPHSGSSEEA